MTTTSTPEQGSRAQVRPPRAGQSNGQWLVDGTAPLNANEVFKAESPILSVRDRIIETYAKQGFDSIDPDASAGWASTPSVVPGSTVDGPHS